MAYTQQPRIQGSGFYNPFSASPNFGAGFSGMIRETIMLQKQKEQEKEEQERYEAEQVSEQEQMEIARRRQTTYEQQVKQQKPKDWRRKYEDFLEITGDKNSALMFAMGFNPGNMNKNSLEEMIQRNVAVKMVDRLFPDKKKDGKTGSKEPVIKLLLKDVEKKIDTITGKQGTSSDMIKSLMTTGKLPFNILKSFPSWTGSGSGAIAKDEDRAKRVANLFQLGDYLRGMLIKEANNQLTADDYRGLYQVGIKFSQIEQFGLDEVVAGEVVSKVGDVIEDAATPPESISLADAKGATVHKYPDGKEYVQVDGKWRLLIR